MVVIYMVLENKGRESFAGTSPRRELPLFSRLVHRIQDWARIALGFWIFHIYIVCLESHLRSLLLRKYKVCFIKIHRKPYFMVKLFDIS